MLTAGLELIHLSRPMVRVEYTRLSSDTTTTMKALPKDALYPSERSCVFWDVNSLSQKGQKPAGIFFIFYRLPFFPPTHNGQVRRHLRQ